MLVDYESHGALLVPPSFHNPGIKVPITQDIKLCWQLFKSLFL